MGYPGGGGGSRAHGERVVQVLRRHSALGLRPVSVLDDDPARHGRLVAEIPVVGGSW